MFSFAFKSQKVFKNFKDYLKDIYKSQIDTTRLVFFDSVPFCGLDVVEDFIFHNYDCKLFSEALIDSKQLEFLLKNIKPSLITENNQYE